MRFNEEVQKILMEKISAKIVYDKQQSAYFITTKEITGTYGRDKSKITIPKGTPGRLKSNSTYFDNGTGKYFAKGAIFLVDGERISIPLTSIDLEDDIKLLDKPYKNIKIKVFK